MVDRLTQLCSMPQSIHWNLRLVQAHRIKTDLLEAMLLPLLVSRSSLRDTDCVLHMKLSAGPCYG